MSKKILSALMALVLAAVACNLPGGGAPTQPAAGPDAAFTAAAQTVEAQLSLVAQPASPTTAAATPIPPTAAPPTSSPPTAIPPTAAPPTAVLPTAIPPTPTQECDKAQFIADVTIPDGSTFAPGVSFTKTWRVKNIGTCSWTPSYSLVFFSGNGMEGPTTISLPGNVNPGQTVDLSVTLKAPAANGTHTGYWKLRNPSGVLFTQMYVTIKVVDSGGGAFAVTSVTLSVSGGCGNFTITAAITVNGPGTVTYKWVRSDGATDTAAHPPLVFAAAGTQSVSTQWFVSASGSKWMDIYIDTPNHQQFGRANFSCP